MPSGGELGAWIVPPSAGTTMLFIDDPIYTIGNILGLMGNKQGSIRDLPMATESER